ncbi:hypothetical protein [Streptomyces sp. NPDC007355]|uniref:hypothetical protein n=1 Tax=Streptomyces sp. NPDC007355 TaxID=3364778 RepID=UPI0036D06B77
MEPLPIPCPVGLIPDATDAEAFDAAYRAAREQRVVFVAVEHHGLRWMVRVDALTAPRHILRTAVCEAVREAVACLADTGQVRSDSFAGPVYCVLQDVDSGPRARELAAALHAAFYGDLRPLNQAVTRPS